MPEVTWFQLATAALGGGLTVKVLDIVYREARFFAGRKTEARAFVDRHLDPLLKSADELFGKLRALAESDFRKLRGFAPKEQWQFVGYPDMSGLLYLFASFWCRVEILRKEGLYVELVRDKRGRRLKNFLECLESRRLRIVDRITQRAVGELMIEDSKNSRDVIAYVRLAQLFEDNTSYRVWLKPLVQTLSRTHHTASRQKLLVYGTILHAMIDTLDSNHYATKERPGYGNKLSTKSKRDLKYRVFGVYVPYVKNRCKYLGRSIGRKK